MGRSGLSERLGKLEVKANARARKKHALGQREPAHTCSTPQPGKKIKKRKKKGIAYAV